MLSFCKRSTRVGLQNCNSDRIEIILSQREDSEQAIRKEQNP